MYAPVPLLILLVLSGNAIAHDLWVEREGPLHTLQYGHERSGHEGAKRLEYRPASVRRAACFDATGREISARVESAWPTTLKGDCAASVFLVSSGYWSKTPYGTKNLPKTEAGAVIDSWLSVESVKRIDDWGEGLSRPLTGELEMVPLRDPLRLKAGDKLHLAVYLRGKPAVGVTVAYFGHPRGVTDPDGRINVRLKAPGIQLIQASMESPLNDGKADRLIQAAALQFEVTP